MVEQDLKWARATLYIRFRKDHLVGASPLIDITLLPVPVGEQEKVISDYLSADNLISGIGIFCSPNERDLEIHSILVDKHVADWGQCHLGGDSLGSILCQICGQAGFSGLGAGHC